MKKETKKENQEAVVIKNHDSALNAFIKREVASDNEVETFEKFLKIDAKSAEIEENLAKIYKNEKGEKVDITRFDKKNKWGLLGWLLFLLFILFSISGGAWSYYQFYFLNQVETPNEPVKFNLEGPLETTSEKEFYYNLNYENPTNTDLVENEFKVVYPDNFIFIDSYPQPEETNKTLWKITKINAQSTGTIKIKGKLIGAKGSKHSLWSSFAWRPSNSSASFKSEQALETFISDIPLSFDFTAPKSVLVDQPSKIIIKYQTIDQSSSTPSFNLRFDPIDNLEIINLTTETETEATSSKIWEWKITPNQKTVDHFLELNFKVTKKINDTVALNLKFETGNENNLFPFLTQIINFSVAKNDFNLNLIVNGSVTSSQVINLGDTLNFSLYYNNKGENDLENVALMAVLDGDILDWSTLKASSGGKRKNNALMWTQSDLTDLKTIRSGEDGSIDFSIQTLEPKEAKKSTRKIYKITSYGQYSFASSTPLITGSNDFKSNTIEIKANSDLTLNERLMYFNEDNIPVGSGPIPPKINTQTIYQVKWNLKNSLHELKDLLVSVKLPPEVEWIASMNKTEGELNYFSDTREVRWTIPATLSTSLNSQAEFRIGITPSEADKDKVMIILPGTNLSAEDKETKSLIKIDLKAKTSRLEDDEIGISDGVVK